MRACEASVAATPPAAIAVVDVCRNWRRDAVCGWLVVIEISSVGKLAGAKGLVS
jgi:hypothetical protein